MPPASGGFLFRRIPRTIPGVRRGPGTLYRQALTLRYLVTRDRGEVVALLCQRPAELPRRLRLLARLVGVTNAVRGYHTLGEMLTVALAILDVGRRRPPVVVECGVGYGASTAKLSLAVAAAGGHLHAFDSFRGIPPNDEEHRHLDGRVTTFRPRAFRGRLRRVERVLARWGEPGVVTVYKGWFEDTLPTQAPPRVDVAVLDVDLLASTRTCLVQLFPRLAPDGVLFTQDGHLQGVVELLGSPTFWQSEVGIEPPAIPGLGRRKLLAIRPTKPNLGRGT